MRILRLYTSIIVASYLLWGCAKQTVPSGGPKDETPPRLLKSIPINRANLFSGNEINLWFDEYVQLNNPREQIIIVPPVDMKKVEFMAKKNRIIIRLNQPLLENTTYTLSFREGIQDITERNPVRDLRFAFSTGPVLDSVKVTGTIYDLLTGEPVPECIVALIELNDTTDILNQKPLYFSMSDKKGEYQLENLKPGIYELYAFKDGNKNLTIESRTEPFAFLPRPLHIDSVHQEVNLYLYKLDMRPLTIATARPVGNHFIIRANKGFADYDIQTENESTVVYHDEPENGTLRIYNTLINNIDSIRIYLRITDSLYQTIDTSLYVRFSSTSLKPEQLIVKKSEITYDAATLKVSGTLTFNKPIYQIRYDSLMIVMDTTHFNIEAQHLTWNRSRTSCFVSATLPGKLIFEKSDRRTQQVKEPNNTIKTNTFIAGKGTFISVEKDTSQSISAIIKEIKPEETATLIYKVESTHKILAELYQKDKIIMRENQNPGTFRLVPPGQYQLRVFIDENNNGKWDWGNYRKREPPEPVIHYKENENKTIPLKANWEVGPLLIKYEPM